jgi:hypothetical protein
MSIQPAAWNSTANFTAAAALQNLLELAGKTVPGPGRAAPPVQLRLGAGMTVPRRISTCHFHRK